MGCAAAPGLSRWAAGLFGGLAAGRLRDHERRASPARWEECRPAAAASAVTIWSMPPTGWNMIVAQLEAPMAAHVAGEHVGQGRWAGQRRPGVLAGPGTGPEAAAGGSGVLVGRPDVAEVLHEGGRPALVRGGQHVVESTLVGGLGEEFREVAVDVGLGGPVLEANGVPFASRWISASALALTNGSIGTPSSRQ